MIKGFPQHSFLKLSVEKRLIFNKITNIIFGEPLEISPTILLPFSFYKTNFLPHVTTKTFRPLKRFVMEYS